MIVAVVDDMFFAAKIRGTAEQLGMPVKIVKDIKKIVGNELAPRLIIVDLQAARFDPFAVATEVKADARLRETKLLGFFSHVENELARRARASGFDVVMPRSVFARRLPEILCGGLDAEAAKSNDAPA